MNQIAQPSPFGPFVFGKGAHAERNRALHEAIVATRDRKLRERAARATPAAAEYPLARLANEISSVLSAAGISGTAALAPVDREKFDADFCVTVPAQLKALGSKEYITQVVPKIAAALEGSTLRSSGAVTRVDRKGMYVNLKLSSAWLFGALRPVAELRAAFGTSDSFARKAVVIDYSAPNAAKHLHAGHIRSTIIGQVLCNLYDAAGAVVHGINHINDLGGFGFLLEGWDRWERLLPAGAPGERLAGLYGVFRKLEKIFDEKKEFSTRAPEDRDLVERHFPGCADLAAFSAAWKEYVATSNRRFERLEEGEPAEVTRWAEMMQWSLDDFQKFYDVLGINFDYTIGESFYAADGSAIVDEALRLGKAKVFSESDAAAERATLDRELAEEKINAQRHQELSESAKNQINAVVIPLGDHQRLLIRRSDGRTIYATRDVAAVHYRVGTFAPWRMTYEVGQEQKEHFAAFFAASRLLGIDGGAELEHIYHGFYVDSKTKKKLSSREGASNVHRLLAETTAHFQAKYSEHIDWPADEVSRTARRLAVGSIVINDIKKDKKANVEISSDIAKAVTEFEQAGGAYLMYSACRARSILRKYGKALPSHDQVPAAELDSMEAELVKRLLEFPGKVRQAAENEDPSQLVTHLFDTARLYNSYYTAVPVLKGGEAHLHRLVLTAAVATMLENGLRICHVECPERI